MPNEVEVRAIDFVTRHLERKGFAVENVSKGKGRSSEHHGYDLIARSKPGEMLKIEVKGCTRLWGIPDLYETEFDPNLRLVADFLYVVYFENERPVRLCAIPRQALKAEDITPRRGYRIRSSFKNQKSLEPFLQEI